MFATWPLLTRPELEDFLSEEAALLVMAELGELTVELAADEVVFVLHRDHPRQAGLVGEPQEAADAPRSLVGNADRADLALLDQRAER